MFMMITKTVLFLILKSTESTTSGSGPIKTINKRGSFQMLGRTSLAATPFIIAIQDCLHSLHRLMSQASFFLQAAAAAAAAASPDLPARPGGAVSRDRSALAPRAAPRQPESRRLPERSPGAVGAVGARGGRRERLTQNSFQEKSFSFKMAK